MNSQRTTVGTARYWRAAVVVSSALAVCVPAVLASVASAQPAPAASSAAPPPPAPTETAVTTPAPEAPNGPAVAAPAPAAPVATAPATTTAPPLAQPPKHDEYDGPPLLLTPKNKKPKLGGYGGLTVAYSHMLHRDGVLIGGEGGMLIEHRLTLGGAGYGFSRTPGGPPAADGTSRQFSSGYGGFVIRYAVYSDIPLYASFGVLIGGGAVSLAPHPQHNGDMHAENIEVRGYFVLQPDVSIHVNATRWLRFSLTAGYRVATAVEAFRYQADDVGGVVLGGNIQMGWF